MKYFSLFLLLGLMSSFAFAQNDYYKTDTSVYIGIEIQDAGREINSQICQVVIAGEVKAFSPMQVLEYGLKDGRIYVSKKIQSDSTTKQVFLERLYYGNTILYFYQTEKIKTFYVEMDGSQLIEISKKNVDNESFSDQLLNLTFKCPSVSYSCKLTRYNRRSLTQLISMFDKCEEKSFSRMKYGVILGYDWYKPNISSSDIVDLAYFDFAYDGSPSFGFFINTPILASNFSIQTELYFTQHGFSYNYFTPNNDFDIVINTSSLRIPVLFKYTLPLKKIRPYIGVGAIWSNNITNENTLYLATTTDSIVEIKPPVNDQLISNSEFGFIYGAGLEYDFRYNKSLFIEFRQAKQFGQSRVLKDQSSIFQISTGINF